MTLVKPIGVKTKLICVALAYAAVLSFAAGELFARYMYESNHAADVAAASGMYAGGDMLLEIFIVFLFMIPTYFLIRIGAPFETPYTAYSKVLLIVGFTAPVCLGLLLLGKAYLPESLSVLCLERLLWSPFILMLIAISRRAAKFDRAKRAISYALLSEAFTFCLSIALIIFSTPPTQL
jgi:hypothetical protein